MVNQCANEYACFVYLLDIKMGNCDWLIDWSIIVFFHSEGHVALDRYPRTKYNTILLQLTPVDLLNACPHRLQRIACHAGRQFVPSLW